MRFYYNYYASIKQKPLVKELSDEVSAFIVSDGKIKKVNREKLDKCVLCCIQNCITATNKTTNTLTLSLKESSFYVGPIFNGVEVKSKKLSYTYFKYVIEYLYNYGYIDLTLGYSIKGKYGVVNNKSSSIKILEPFVDILKPYLSSDDYDSSKVLSCVVLKDEKGKPKAFRVVSKVKHYIESMNAYNSVFKDRVKLGDETLEIFFCRIFKNTFSEFGRYNERMSNFQTLKPDTRKQIMIDGEPVVEIDFNSLHTSICYSSLCIDIPSEFGDKFDPYTIELKGYSDFTNRKLGKLCMMALLNTTSRRSALGVINAEIQEDRDLVVNKGGKSNFGFELKDFDKIIKVSEALDLTYERNVAIEEYFFKDNSKWLQNKESEIAEYVVSYFSQRNEPCLCIHDSFIVKERLADTLEKAMIDGFSEVVGFKQNCKVSRK